MKNLYKSLILLSSLFLNFELSYCQSGSSSSCLIAKYNFSGNSYDSSGNNYHLTNVGATLVKDRFGNAKSAYNFNGSQYLWATADTHFSKTEFTTAFWARPEDNNDGSNRILAVGPKSTFWHYYCNVIIPGVKTFGFVGHNKDGSYSFYDYNSNGYTPNQWTHVVSIYKNDSVFIYIDGKLDKKTKGNNKVVTFTSNQVLQLGAAYYPDSPKAGYVGDIDDVRIYCNALSDKDVLDLYNEGNSASITANAAKEEYKVEVFPNPAHQDLILKFDLKENVKISGSIYNMQGKLIENINSISGTGTINIDISNYAADIYFVKFIDPKSGLTKNVKLSIY